jgi:DNA-binding MurR/RpiR family transcriptional regulator
MTVTDLTALSALVAERFEGLSPQLRKAARFLIDHPDDVALRSMRDLALEVGVPAATFVRLTRALGFGDYAELRALFQEDVRGRGVSGQRYSGKARQLQSRGGESDAALELLKDLFDAEIGNIELTFERNHPSALLRAVERIERAETIRILGQRSAFPTAYFFNYVYRLFRGNSVLLQNTGGSLADELRGIAARDVLIAVSMAPYTREVVDAVQFAREQGAQIIAITDDRLSPLGRVADEVLLVASGTPSFFHSIIATVTLAQALLALLVARGGADALGAIERSEQQLERFKAYWPDETRRNPEE